MKSFPDLQPSGSRPPAPWNPAELGPGLSAAPNLEQRKLLQALFGQPADRPVTNTKLVSAQAVGHFSAWLPDEIEVMKPRPRAAEWVFADLLTDITPQPVPPPSAAPTLEPQPAAHGNPRSDPHNAAKMLAEAEAEAAKRITEAEAEAAQILAQARLQAEEMLLTAQGEADALVAQAEDEIEAQKKDGYRQGWEAASAEIRETLKATNLSMEEVRAWKADLVGQGEQILISMLKDIAQKMFGEGVTLDTNALQVNLNHILENAQGLGDLNIFINPRDAKNLDPSWSEYQRLISGKDVKIIPSGKIARGGCFVKGEMGIVDGRVETQLAAVLKMLDEASASAE